jgi:hypothetical protein
MSAKTKVPELLCKWADFWFDETGMALAHYGPFQGGNIDTYGMTSGWRWDNKINWIVYDDILNDKENKYGGMENPYRQQKIMIATGVGFGDLRDFFGATANIAGVNYRRVWAPDSLDFRHYWSVVENLKPYYVKPYPGNIFFSSKVANRILDLQSVIRAYAEAESAKFVTGARPITDAELKDYFDRLDTLGYQEYLKYYVDYYAANVK